MDSSTKAGWAECLSWTARHLSAQGDTDIFPTPVEYTFLCEQNEQVGERLAALDLCSYSPNTLVHELAPKGRFTSRTVHQMNPVDAVLFTALVSFIGSKIEAIRLPASSTEAFSYRFQPTVELNFFSPDRNYSSWLKAQFFSLFAESYEYVIRADISDFYQHIYHHRLRNSLEEAAGASVFTSTIMKMLKVWRARQSFGIPVGGNASRLLAELCLNDIDRALNAEGYRCTRYVDDIVIWISAGQDPYEALLFLTEQLAQGEGMALSPMKTKILDWKEYVDSLEEQSGEDDAQAEKSATERLFWEAYNSEGDNREAVEALSRHDLAKELDEALNEDHWSVAKIRVLLKACRLPMRWGVYSLLKRILTDNSFPSREM